MIYAIQIKDSTNKNVGELMTASISDILALLNKGMIVTDKNTGHQFTIEEVSSMIGVSDGLVMV